MEFSYEGIGQVVATFANPEGIEPGMAVTIVDNDTVGMGYEGDFLCGVVLTAEGDVCAVQVGGFVKVRYSGTSAGVGFEQVGVDGSGGIVFAVGDGCYHPVVDVDAENHTAVIKL